MSGLLRPVEDSEQIACTFSSDDGDTLCGATAIWHVLIADWLQRFSILIACREHIDNALSAARVVDVHRFLPAECGVIENGWELSLNRCTPPAGPA